MGTHHTITWLPANRCCGCPARKSDGAADFAWILQLPARDFLRISPQTDPIAATVPWSIYINLQPSADNRLSGGQAHSVPPALRCSSHLWRRSESSASAAVPDNPDSGSGEHFLPHPERLSFRRPDRLPAFHTAQHPANARRSEPLPE